MKIHQTRLLTVTEVANRIKRALLTKRPLSIIRLGNGEAITLAHGALIPPERIPSWVEYAGVKLPNEAARQALLFAVREADIVGVSTDYQNWDCAPLLETIFTIYKPQLKHLTDAAINWQLHKYDRLYSLIGNAPTVLVGRLAQAASPLLQQKGMNIIQTVNLDGFHDLARAEAEILSGPSFRVALVAAGIPAAIICPRLAKRSGCIAIDYGHVINDLLQPGFGIRDLALVTERWFQEKAISPN